MFNKFSLALTFSAVVVSLNTFATPLESYQTSAAGKAFLKGKDIADSGLTLKKTVQKQLHGAPNDRLSDLLKISLASLNSKPRVNFSNNINRFLKSNASTLQIDEAFQKPTTINPRWTPEDAALAKQARKENVCLSQLKSFKVDDIITHLLDEAGKSENSYSSSLTEKEISLVARLNNILPSSIKEKIGPIVRIDVTNGFITELHVSKKSNGFNDLNSLSVSLPMLVNFRLGRDEYFVDSVGCLYKYFKEQIDILEIRQSELKDDSIAESIQKIKKSVELSYEQFKQGEGKNSQLSKDDFFRLQYLDLAKNQEPIAAYLLKKEKYLIAKDKVKEEELITNENRISHLKTILPYFKKKLKGSQFTHREMSQLSQEELNSLLNVMISLRAADLPGLNEVNLIKNFVVEKNDPESTADMFFYDGLFQSLTDLSLTLSAPVPQ